MRRANGFLLGLMATAVLVIAVRMARPVTAGSTRVLRPEGIFTAATKLVNPRLIAVSARMNKLYFLWASKTDRAMEVTRTDEHGTVEIHFPVASFPIARRFRVDPSGSVAILWGRVRPVEAVISRYDENGLPQGTLSLSTRVDDIQFSGSNLIGINHESVFLLNEVDGTGQAVAATVTPIEVRSPFRTLPLPQNRVAVIRMTDVQFQVAEVGRVVTPPFLLASPEIHRTAETKPDAEAALIYDAAASPTGHIYLALTGYQIHDGAMVTTFDRNGLFAGSFRCWLPSYPDLVIPDNVYGHMVPSFIVISMNYVYLADPVSRRVAYYRLADR